MGGSRTLGKSYWVLATVVVRFREQGIFGTLGKKPNFATVMIPKKGGLRLSRNGLNKYMRFITRNPKKDSCHVVTVTFLKVVEMMI